MIALRNSKYRLTGFEALSLVFPSNAGRPGELGRVRNAVLRAVAGLVGFMFCGSIHAQVADVTPQDVFRYRVISAPVEKIEELAVGEYRPMSRDVFRRRAQALRQQLPAEYDQGAALLTSKYSAQLDSRRLLIGVATLEVAHLKESDAWLSLAPINFGLSHSKWISGTGEGRDVILGSHVSGASVLNVVESGTLEARWTLAPTSMSNDDLVFDLQLPICPVRQLQLQIPSEFELEVDNGVFRRVESDHDPADTQGGPGTIAPVSDWEINVGGHPTCQIRMHRRDARRRRAGMTQRSRYIVSEQGLDFTADISLDCDNVELSRLILQIDTPLRLTKVVHESQPLRWSEYGETDRTQLVAVDFDVPLRGLNRIVQISAVAPPEFATDGTLPRVRITNVDWIQESSRVQINAPFVLQKLDIENGIRTRSVDDPEPVLRSLAFQYFDAEHQTRLQLSQDAEAPYFTTATNLVAGSNELQADVEVDLRSRSANQFEVEADIRDGWNLESVEAAADMLDEWTVLSSPTSARRIQIRFKRPVPRNDWIRLSIRARRAVELGPEPIPIQRLMPVEFANVQEAPRQFLSLPQPDEVRTHFPHDERITWLSWDDLDARETDLIKRPMPDRLILMDPPSMSEFVVFEEAVEAAAAVTAKLQILTQLSSRRIKEQVRVELTRLQRAPREFQVHLSERRPIDFRWYLERDPQQKLSAQRRSADRGAPGEIWSVEWPDRSGTSLVVVGERSWPVQATTSIALARVTDAKSQEGTVVLEYPADDELAMTVSPLFTPLPSEQGSFHRFENVRSIYRYAPMADIFSRNNAMSVSLNLHPAPSARTVVWRAAVTSNLDPSRSVRSDVTLWVENLGAEFLRIRLPNESIPRQFEVDGRDFTPASDGSGWLELPMPAGQRFPRVQLQYEHRDMAVGWLEPLRPQFPEIEVPVLSRVWNVWTSPELGIVIEGSGRSSVTPLNFFRPVVRPPTSRPFNLFSRSDWKEQFSSLWIPSRELTPRTVKVLEALGREDALTLGYGLQTLDDADIRLDTVRLAEINVQPQTGLPTTLEPSDLLRGIDRLERLHLGLIEVDGDVVLTAENVLAELPEAVHCRASASIALIAEHDAAQWRERNGDALNRRLVSASQWQAKLVTWPMTEHDRSPFVAAGWHIHAVPDFEDARVTVFRYPTLRIATNAILIASLSLAWWLGRVRPRRSVLIPAIVIIIALISVGPFQILALSALWGSLIGVLIPRFHRPPRPALDDRWAAMHHPRAQQKIGTMVVIALLVTPHVAIGQLATNEGQPSPILEVFDPIDTNGDPAGQQLYVPLPLYRRLAQPGTRAAGQAPNWILTRATYTGAVESKADSSRMELSTITADYELYVSSVSEGVQFPLVGESMAALRRDAYLDGRRFELQWDAARSTLALPIYQTGRHQLQLSFQTATVTQDGYAHIRLPIIRNLEAQLRLTSPHDIQSLQVPSARGGIRRLESQGQLTADLGMTDVLQVRWPTSVTPTANPPVDVLSWLMLYQDEARYEVQMVPQLARLNDSALVLEVDERLHLDAANFEDRMSLVPGSGRGVRGLRFDLAGLEQDASVVQLSFRVTGATGIGKLRIPRCRIVGHEANYALAVSTNAQLSLEVTPGNAATLAPEEFMRRWGGTQPPEFAFVIPLENSQWSCHGQWLTPAPRINVQEAQIVGRDGTRVVLVATIDVKGRDLFQQTLKVPESFIVESIQANSASPASISRWSRDSNGQVTVLLDDPVSDRLQLAIVGYGPDVELERRQLPRITFPDSIMESRQVDVFRMSEVLIDGLLARDLPPPPELAPFIRNQVGLARWQRRAEDASGDDWTVRLKVNHRQLHARLFNVISRDEGIWRHSVRAECEMKKGVLDSLTFEIPEAWAGAMLEEPGLRHFLSQSAQPGMVRITLWPFPQPFDTDSVLEFFGDIPTSPGQPLKVPNIRLLNDGDVHGRLYLPSRLDGQPILWSTTGMKSLNDGGPPESLAQSAAEYQTFAIPDTPYQAVRLPVRTAVSAPTVSLNDVYIAWRSPDDYQGMALMDLRPDGLDECYLHAPANLSVAAIYVDQTPVADDGSASPSSAEGKRYRIQLTSNALPQRIRVMFSGRALNASTSPSPYLASPTLSYSRPREPESVVPIPSDVTLWTVHSIGSGPINLQGELPTIGPLDQRRLSNFQDVMDQAARHATDFSPDDLARWYTVWGRRFLTAIERMSSPESTGAESEAISHAVLRARELHIDAALQLNVDSVFHRLQTEENLGDAAGVWRDALAPIKAPSYRMFEGTRSQVPVNVQPRSPTRRYVNWIAAIGIGLAALATQRWPRDPRGFAPRWPLVAGVLCGLAWWLFLEPSLLGWAIVGLSLAVTEMLP